MNIWYFRVEELNPNTNGFKETKIDYLVTPPCDAETACRFITDHYGECWKIIEVELKSDKPLMVLPEDKDVKENK